MSHQEKHILIVDDEPFLVRLNKRQLENEGYRVSVSTESLEALKEFQKSPEVFDLLLTDLTMPGMSGLELIKAVLKESPNLPVIVLTGLVDEDTEERLFDLGVAEIVTKPVMEGELITAVDRVFDKVNG